MPEGHKVTAADQQSEGILLQESFPAQIQSDMNENQGECTVHVHPTQEAIKTILTQAGGIFIGKEELVRLGKLASDAVVHEIPERYNAAFFQQSHPLREGTIAAHIILAFDPTSNQWLCVDRGKGGESDIVPGSLGLGGSEQDRIIEGKSIAGVSLSSPVDSYPYERVVVNAAKLHLLEGKPKEKQPFRDIWARTADTTHAKADCRVLLGNFGWNGTIVYDCYHSVNAGFNVGLFAVWN